MKNILLFAALTIMVLSGCEKQNPQRVHVPDSTFVPPDMANDEVETNEVFPAFRASALEPDFWDPNYRSYKIVNMDAEVSYTLFLKWNADTNLVKTNIRRYYQNSSTILEQITGLRIVLNRIKIWTGPDSYELLTSAQNILYQWGPTAQVRYPSFQQFLNNKTLGGSGYVNGGNVTTARFSVVTLGGWNPASNTTNYSFGEYCIMHELLHNLGLRHSQNDCAWFTKEGLRKGPLDHCGACENSSACPPSSGCTSQTWGSDGGIMSYCHLYSRMKWMLEPEILAVLHRSVYYAAPALPDYTPTPKPVTPSVVITPSSYLVSGGAFHSGLIGNMFDRITNTNVSRYVLKDSMIVNANFGGQKLDSVQLFTGFLSGGVWTSPVSKVSILRNGVWTTNVTNNPVQKGYSLGGVSTTSVRIKFGPGDFARVREIVFWGKP